MKTYEQILQYKSSSFDGRDVSRLISFIKEEDLPKMNVELKAEYVGKHEALPLTKENVLKQLEGDLEFAFEKALNQRGLSASAMNDVIKMWNWILQDGLEDYDEYAQYGLPTLKATAEKYGFNNLIGQDTGSEFKYSSEAY